MNKNTTHKLYARWKMMMDRCYNASNISFERYGKRGITVDGNWHNFNNFLVDMESSFETGLQIDRINNNKGYSKENCRWVTPKQNSINRRNTKFFNLHGISKTLTDWAKDLNVNRSLLSQRIYVYKWPVEKALTKGVNFG